jgi:D-3-phosphoglycerate dehydrogenase
MPTTDRSPTVLVTTSSFAAECPQLLAGLREAGLNMVLNPWRRKLTEPELGGLLEEHRPVGLLAGTEPITRRVLATASGYLRVISRVGVGWDNVDRHAAAEFGIQVYRTSGVLTQAVAELTLGLMLTGLRAIAFHDRLLRQGVWKKHLGGLLQGKVVGIIGFGAIGQCVGELVTAFGARVIYHDPRPLTVAWAEPTSLTHLLSQADIISLHADGQETILGPREFQAIGRRAVLLINTARGALVDEETLYASLQAGDVGYAGLDVFKEEPYRGPLRTLDNVVLTPHIGSYPRETRRLMEETAVSHLMAGLQEAGLLA